MKCAALQLFQLPIPLGLQRIDSFQHGLNDSVWNILDYRRVCMRLCVEVLSFFLQ